MPIKWEDRYDHLGNLPEFVLFSLATNDSASVEYRRTALEIMVKKGYKSAENPIFRGLGLEFEVLEIPEVVPDAANLEPEDIRAPFVGSQEHINMPNLPSRATVGGPLTASVTTTTMFGAPEVIDNTPDFQKMDTPSS